MPLWNLEGEKKSDIVIHDLSVKDADMIAVYLDNRHIPFSLTERTHFEKKE